MRVSRRTLLAGTLPALAGGCLGWTREPAAGRAIEPLAATPDVEALTGRVAVSVDVADESERYAVDVWRDGERLRHEFDADPERTVVSTPEGSWFHRGGGAFRLDHPIGDAGLYRIEPDALVERRDAYRVERRGTTTVAGRSARRIVLDAESGAPTVEYYTFQVAPEPPTVRPTRVECYVDEETGVVLRQDLEIEIEDGPTAASTSAYEEVAFDLEIDPARFEFDPPPDAVVREDVRAVGETYDSIPRAELDAGFRFGGPERVGGYELRTLSLLYGPEGRQLRGTYAAEPGSRDLDVSVEVSLSGYPHGLDERHVTGETTIGDARARVAEIADYPVVEFECGGRYYTVSGNLESQVSEETVRDVAAAIEC